VGHICGIHRGLQDVRARRGPSGNGDRAAPLGGIGLLARPVDQHTWLHAKAAGIALSRRDKNRLLGVGQVEPLPRGEGT